MLWISKMPLFQGILLDMHVIPQTCASVEDQADGHHVLEEVQHFA